LSKYRLKHVVRNPVKKAPVNGAGRIDLEDIAAGNATLISTADERSQRTGEGVIFEAMDVLFGKLRPYLRKSLLCDSSGLCSPELLVLRPDRSRIEPRFLHYIVRSPSFAAWTQAASKGTRMPRTDFDVIGQFEVDLPPFDEQRCIADFLDEIHKKTSELTALNRQLLHMLYERDQATVAEVIEGLTVSARPLGQIANFVAGSGFPHQFQGHSSGDLPFIKVSDMHRPGSDVYVSDAENWISLDVANELGARVVPKGAVIFPKVGAAMLKNPRRLSDRPCVIDNNVLAVIPEAVSARFLRYTLRLVDCTQFANPGPIPSLNLGVFSRVKVKVPNRGEQEAIADRLDVQLGRHSRLRAVIKKQASLLDERRDALIAAAVTGELDPSFYGTSAVAA
jgi:type I restriction enzyme S subunit